MLHKIDNKRNSCMQFVKTGFRNSKSVVQKATAALAVTLIAFVPCHVAAQFQANWSAPHAPDSLIVAFTDEGKAQSVRGTVHSSVGTTATHSYKYIDADVVQLPANMNPKAAAALYEKNPNVRYVQPNYIYSISNTYPNDPQFSSQWGLHNTGQSGGTVDADIDAPEAWDMTTGSTDIVVAIIDTGVDYTHPDLINNMWINEAEALGTPGVDDDGNNIIDDIHGAYFVWGAATGDPMDTGGHGTHVAGIAGATTNNGTGVAGVTWNVQLMALAWLDPGGLGQISDAIKAIEYALDKGAPISNNSWRSLFGYDQALYDVIQVAETQNHLFVTAAGNSVQNNDINPTYPGAFDLPNIVTVASSNRFDQPSASFTNWGPTTVDLAAPGEAILSTHLNHGYMLDQGTSMASPHVAGAAALLLSLLPNATYAELKQLLLNGVDPIAAFGPGGTHPILTGGRLNIANSIDLIPVGSICEKPQPAQCGVTYQDPVTHSSNAGDDVVSCFQGVSNLQGLWFEIDVPANETVGVTVNDYDFSWYAGVDIYSDCGGSLLASECSTTGEATARYHNSSASPITVKVLINVHEWVNPPSVTFLCAPRGECWNALEAECGVTYGYPETHSSNAGDDVVSCFQGVNNLQGLWFEITVPSNQTMSATVIDHDFSWYAGVEIYDSCDGNILDYECSTQGEATASYQNTTDNPVTVKVLFNVHEWVNPPSVSFECTPIGSACWSPIQAQCGVTYGYPETHSSNAGDDVVSCFQGIGVLQGLWFEIEVPANKTLKATVNDYDFSWYAGVDIYASCGGTLLGFNCSTSGKATAAYSNPTANPVTVKVLINVHEWVNPPSVTFTCN